MPRRPDWTHRAFVASSLGSLSPRLGWEACRGETASGPSASSPRQSGLRLQSSGTWWDRSPGPQLWPGGQGNPKYQPGSSSEMVACHNYEENMQQNKLCFVFSNGDYVRTSTRYFAKIKKCLSTASMAVSCANAHAAMRRSLVGTGVPLRQQAEAKRLDASQTRTSISRHGRTSCSSCTSDRSFPERAPIHNSASTTGQTAAEPSFKRSLTRFFTTASPLRRRKWIQLEVSTRVTRVCRRRATCPVPPVS